MKQSNEKILESASIYVDSYKFIIIVVIICHIIIL